MRARGEGFFAAVDTQPYQSHGILLGQETEYSCVAACCRMLLFDQVPGAENDYLVSESFLRTALQTNYRGSTVAQIPDVMRDHGSPLRYVYRKNLTIDDLQAAVEFFPAVALVSNREAGEYHAVIVDGVNDESVWIRDPLPESTGSAYSLAQAIFLTAWINESTNCGYAVVVLQ